MYQALYRKWRPRVFADVVGQEHVTQTLRHQVAEGRTSHAYLFTGTRGTGKTTCAKILARAVNCENPRDGDPCGECPACVGLESGRFLDVLELDAASNNGVDQVRALRDEAVYAPANVRTRVYIVDEVHMLSTPAFNALLKILEEPPEHLMFILATTELHKVPATILSRCQRYAFKRILPRDIQGRLAYVAEQEKLPLTEDGAALLSRLADGALRDALSLLDQCAASGGTIDSAAVLDTLGLAGQAQTIDLCGHILRRDAGAALALFGTLYEGGKDPATVLGELSGLVRDLMLRQIAPGGGAALRSYDDTALRDLPREIPPARLLYMSSTLQRDAAALYNSSSRRTDAELCLLRLCDETLSEGMEALAARLERLEELMERGGLASLPTQTSPARLRTPSASPAQTWTPPVPPVQSRTPPGSPAQTRTPFASPAQTRTPPGSPAQTRTPSGSPVSIQEPSPPSAPVQSPPAVPLWDGPDAPPERDNAPPWDDRYVPPVDYAPPTGHGSSWDDRDAPPTGHAPPWDDRDAPPTGHAPPWDDRDAPPTGHAPPWDGPEAPPPVDSSPERPPVYPPMTDSSATPYSFPPVDSGPADNGPTDADGPGPDSSALSDSFPPDSFPPDSPPSDRPPPDRPPPDSAVSADSGFADSGGPQPVDSGAADSGPTDAVWWDALMARCLGQLPPFYRAFMKNCYGVLDGGALTIYGPDSTTLGRLNNDRVRSVLMEASGAARVALHEGAPPQSAAQSSPEENLRQLVAFSRQYDNIVVRGDPGAV